MKKRTFISKRLNATLSAFAIAIVAATSAIAADDEFNRTGKTDVYAAGLYLSGDRFDGYSGGLGVGYHFNNYISLNGEATGGSLDADSIHGTLYTGLISVEYNILKRRFTPFLTVGGGVLGFDVNYHYISTSEVDGMLGGGAGLRWDITDRFFVKVTYRALALIDVVGDSELAHSVTFGLGFTF